MDDDFDDYGSDISLYEESDEESDGENDQDLNPTYLYICGQYRMLTGLHFHMILNLLRNRVVQSISLLELLNHLNISSGYLLMTIYQLLIFLVKKRIGMQIKFETVTT